MRVDRKALSCYSSFLFLAADAKSASISFVQVGQVLKSECTSLKLNFPRSVRHNEQFHGPALELFSSSLSLIDFVMLVPSL